jgi:hypothetical protein
MSKHEVAFTTAAAAGFGLALAAGAAVWMLLTNPLALTRVVAQPDTGALMDLLVATLRDVASALLALL